MILYKDYFNGKKIDLEKLKALYGQKELHDWYTGYNIELHVKRGINHLKIFSNDKGGKYGLKIGKSLSFYEYLLLFFFGIVPILIGIYNIVLDYVLDFDFTNLKEKISWKHLTVAILLVGIVLRVFYLALYPKFRVSARLWLAYRGDQILCRASFYHPAGR